MPCVTPPGHDSRALRTRLDAWRGRPYDELGDWPEAVHARCRRLDALRDDAVDALLERDDAGGWSAAELHALAAERPDNERRCAAVMRALYGSGRQVEALEVFEATRSALVERGLAPGPPLVALQRAVLEHDVEAAAPRRAWRPMQEAARVVWAAGDREAVLVALDGAVDAARAGDAPPQTLIELLMESGEARPARVAIRSARSRVVSTPRASPAITTTYAT